MRRYALFVATLVVLLLLPQSASSSIRGCVAAVLMPRGGAKSVGDAIEARVVYRTPATWSSVLWVNVGSKESQWLAKDSPVLVGNSIVGVIDYVGRHQSRVRLITDSALNPSVRVLRGGEADRELAWHLEILKTALGPNPHLDALADLIDCDAPSHPLAKGELHGSGQPLWRGQGNTLIGCGFNYDHPDAFSRGRDLRTGEPFDGKGEAMPILEPGDLLVTTGMDGVFPPGHTVARVTEVETLREGAATYELRAVPTAGDMNELARVVILPPRQLQ